ncbi:cytochrome P450 family protein [Rhizobium bangladeshense]|uniref:cytochrome P450 family protein n=1 Tax=Rhizobium bangladeshense TaxID=1138189 RepID=UPI001A98ADD1|nr:cytochrome P450 [Rhizobium bangladeshense]MBX4932035.1 cytochrome P450 [Rhizobium bangladeshense]MBY3583874.1 cytochrome P450 [Rhizobium bangladeshense]QSY89651.1 cytochrome P450 [Rhizobium bangladeshense]
MAEPHDFDVLSPRFHANPFPTLDRMRAEGAVVRMKLPILGRTWFTVTHDACAALLKDSESFARDPANAGSRTQARILKCLPRTIGLLALNMIGYDDPEHRRLRGLVDQAFQRRSIEAMKPMITHIADRLLDRMEGKREVDLMSEFCRDLPLSVICAVLGLPEQDHDHFKSWLGGLKDTANVGAIIRAIPGVVRAVRYLRRVSRPGGGALSDGLVAALCDADMDGLRLSEDELVSMIFLLFGAGQETTTHLIAGGLFTLLSHEDERLRLQNDPSLMPTCVEECLRYVSPVQMTKPRFARRDMNWQGQQFRRGDMIAAFIAAANCDPAKFENPHRFDITRHPNPHLSFGTGVHFCLGFQLARVEAAIAFERILTRFPSLSLNGNPANIRWRKRLGIRALAHLPVEMAA